MASVLIVYHSRSSNTEAMAKLVAKGAEEAGAAVTIKKAADAVPEDLVAADAVILGSPTYYGLPAPAILDLIEKSVRFHGRLDGKVGGAFASSANIGGGNETTVIALLEALLIHGFIVQGNPSGDHYGPVSIGKPDARVEEQCRELGARIARLSDRLLGSAD